MGGITDDGQHDERKASRKEKSHLTLAEQETTGKNMASSLKSWNPPGTLCPLRVKTI